MVAAVFLCRWLAGRIGPWPTLGSWAAVTALVCSLSAWLLSTVQTGEIGWKNRLAGYVLPWGYQLSNGRLGWIAVASWSVWVLLGLAAVLPVLLGNPKPVPGAAPAASSGSPSWNLALVIAWVVDGALLLFLATTFLKNFGFGSSGGRSLFLPMGFLAAMIVGSAVLWYLGHSRLAVAVAAGPTLAAAVAYALFIALMLIVGRNARWN